jgi:hypothetical protein
MAAGCEAGFYRFQESGRLGLVLEDFEESDDGELGRGVSDGKFRNRKRKNTLNVQLGLDEAYRARIQLYSIDFKSSGTGGEQEISRAAAHVKQMTGFWSVRIAEEIFVARLKGKKASVARTVHPFVPIAIGHFAGMPEVKVTSEAWV